MLMTKFINSSDGLVLKSFISSKDAKKLSIFITIFLIRLVVVVQRMVRGGN